MSRTLLVVDDYADLRETVADLFHYLGYTVLTAADGREAVVLAGSFAFDAIIMDVDMPVMDGLAATRAIRGQGLTVPVVAFTGSMDAEILAATREAGCAAYVAKGGDMWDLVRTVVGCTERQDACES